ncbi:hypothetical protein JOD20_002092 [Herpetosiphon giganteus]|nr:hypothetical protein [Herpetosiphon giganteus]
MRARRLSDGNREEREEREGYRLWAIGSWKHERVGNHVPSPPNPLSH